MKNLPDWLAYCEQLHPKNIDMGLERVRMVAARMGLALNCPVITVAGTNGKGSTCAMSRCRSPISNFPPWRSWT